MKNTNKLHSKTYGWYDRNQFTNFSKYLNNPDNAAEIDAWCQHMRRVYPQINEDPDWLLKKYRNE